MELHSTLWLFFPLKTLALDTVWPTAVNQVLSRVPCGSHDTITSANQGPVIVVLLEGDAVLCASWDIVLFVPWRQQYNRDQQGHYVPQQVTLFQTLKLRAARGVLFASEVKWQAAERARRLIRAHSKFPHSTKQHWLDDKPTGVLPPITC